MMMPMKGRADRSRSPLRVDNVGRRRDVQNIDIKGDNMNMMNQMMMPGMYGQGNMIMGGMYPNMMMPNSMIPSMMQPSGLDLMSAGTGMDIITQPPMDIITQPPMDISPLAGQSAANPSQIDISMMGGMVMDPSIMGNVAMYGSTSGGDISMQDRKEIVLRHCKLSPPDLGTPHPPRRARPPGCRTIFVGGLPDKIRESVVRDIFENYGRIHTLRLSKKNFCHIRFDKENCVDAAMAISGYRIILTDPKDKEGEEDESSHSITGWLHVDYAASRDDQNEFERRQRQVMRQQQQQMQQLSAQEMASRSMTASYRRSPSPVRVQPYSTNAVVQLAEKIKNEEHFANAIPTLLTWLERGECSKKNANQFYSMIQATNVHIRRLCNEKMQAEDELVECKERVKNNIQSIIMQLEQVAKVFTAAGHQRAWDHFTKPQRKNIETWQKMTQEFNSMKEEFNEKFYSEESDPYNNGYNSKALEIGASNSEEVLQLKRENESLQFQLTAYRNEVDVIKADASREMEKFKAQFIARQALQGALDMKNPPLPQPIKKPPPPPPLPDDMDSKQNVTETIVANCGEAKLIGVMSAFLQVHPHGASLDYVLSYVRALFPAVSQASVHQVLQKHTDVFERTTSGVGVNIEHRWSFAAFKKQDDS